MSRSIKVRLGQTSARKVVSSQRAAASSGSSSLDKIENIQDVDITGRSGNTLLMFDSTDNKYKHVDPAQVLDLADSVDDDAFDGGTFT
tara:strand:+ start:10101 stop:10364 length:264 start_codon:yes stop_codon:yes gene_type:complete